MTDEIPRMSIVEFRDGGYLQELNRRFLHPLGLALEVVVDDGPARFGGVWDYRDDPEGVVFGWEGAALVLAAERAARIDREWDEHAPARQARFGSVVQGFDPL